MNKKDRILLCKTGCTILRILIITTVIDASCVLAGYLGYIPGREGITKQPLYWATVTLIIVIIEAAIFWIGIIMVYLTSVQLGIRWRVPKSN